MITLGTSHFSAHVQLFFAKYGTELREKDDRDDTHAVFTKLNEAFICASKDGDIRFVLATFIH